MSAIHERQWALVREREIREEAHKQRLKEIKNQTEFFLKKYESILNELAEDGLEQYIPKECDHVRNEINRIRNNMDALEGREVSRILGNFVRTLPHQAREQHRIAEEYQRLIQEEAKLEAERQVKKIQKEREIIWQQVTSNWQNKLARNLAFKKLYELKQQAFSENWDGQQITEAVDKIKQESEQQAIENEKNFINAVRGENEQKQKGELLKIIKTTNLPKAQSTQLQQKIEQASGENLTKIAQEIDLVHDEIIENEDIRKEMVKAVYQALKQAGFNVLNPIKQKNENGEEIVLVQAARPTGNQAKFRINLNGSVRYEFDNYKGQHCKEDMQKVLPKLSEIYGVNLSKERVIWENPDDTKMDAKPINPIQTNKNIKN
ncbi:hypothetical protein [Neisseria zalophi]|uniref:Uncharacterized protein n=1 Tax=Neisseria zalophi TaxID=640030 RepID=A0A5J6PVT2_9NEIS|nr:hypothetical protein [Neisseria zalophi]QEY26364.1 hypothetical protein D0T92_07380 [Neisseria zalophi]